MGFEQDWSARVVGLGNAGIEEFTMDRGSRRRTRDVRLCGRSETEEWMFSRRRELGTKAWEWVGDGVRKTVAVFVEEDDRA